MSDETLVFYGGAVKALGDGRVGGYLVRFSDGSIKDLEGEYFAADTDYAVDFDAGPKSAVYYHHGLDPVIGKRVLGNGGMKKDEAGIWFEAQLLIRDEYEKEIYQLAELGKLGWSSGTASHLIERTDEGKIMRWPLGLDASLTPTPAEPRNAAMPLKSLTDTGVDLKTLLAAESKVGGTTVTDRQVDVASVSIRADSITIVAPTKGAKEPKMAEEQEVKQPDEGVEVTERVVKAAPEQVQEFGFDQMPAVKARFDELDDKLDQLFAHMESAPAIKNSGYFTQDGGAADKGIKSFGDWCLAVKRGDKKRLKEVYGTKVALAEESGATGGYLVPTEFLPGLLKADPDEVVVRPRARVIPVNSNRGFIPALDQQTAVTTQGAGQSAYAGGAVMTWTGEAAALTETEPVFREVEYNINKMGGFSYVSNELIEDSPQSIEAILVDSYRMAINAMEDYAFLRGDGVAKPLGVLNAGVAIGITPSTNSTFGLEDALAMVARFKRLGGGPVWAMHRSLIPDLQLFTATSGFDLVQPREPVPVSILGWPIMYSEHLPLANASGGVLLADFAGYVIFDRGGVEISFSDHFRFTNDQGTWRVTKRLDGKPWMRSAITPGGPGSPSTEGPFVYHND